MENSCAAGASPLWNCVNAQVAREGHHINMETEKACQYTSTSCREVSGADALEESFGALCCLNIAPGKMNLATAVFFTRSDDESASNLQLGTPATAKLSQTHRGDETATSPASFFHSARGTGEADQHWPEAPARAPSAVAWNARRSTAQIRDFRNWS